MIFRIEHKTVYRYSQPVFPEPMTVRLRPRSDCTQRLLRFQMRVDPEPAGQADCVDLEGNSTRCLWFNGQHRSLVIETEAEVQTLRQNPFDYILMHNGASTLPVEYPPSLADRLQPYHLRPHIETEVDSYAKDLLDEVKGSTLEFLSLLCDRMHADFERIHREKGEPHSPEQTLKTRRGACRDLAVLFNDACRSVGMAARFVGGYHEGDPEKVEGELHAWSEIYLPGAGWRGYDPTHGLAVADRHVAVVAGIDPIEAAPVDGTFRGTGATSEIIYEIRIAVAPEGGSNRSQGAEVSDKSDRSDRSDKWDGSDR
jgi:transglutaminase-like putative cysteine protease